MKSRVQQQVTRYEGMEQQLRDLKAAHHAEQEKFSSEHKGELQAMADRIDKLKRKNTALNSEVSTIKEHL